MSVVVEIDHAALAAFVENRTGPVARHLFVVGMRVKNRARTLAPVDTGALRSSIVMMYDPTPPLAILVGSDLRYAIFVEYGTIKTRAQPFLRPALTSAGVG